MSRMSAAARESRKTCRLNQRVTRGPICSVSSARSSAVSRRTALAYAQGAQLQREQESYPCQSKGNAQEAGEELRGPPRAQRLERASLRALPEDDEQQLSAMPDGEAAFEPLHSVQQGLLWANFGPAARNCRPRSRQPIGGMPSASRQASQ